MYVYSASKDISVYEIILVLISDMGCGCGATSQLVQGVLLTLQQLFSDIKLPLDMLKQV